MQKKIANLLFSTRLTAILFIVFAAAMAIGTFMDADMETSPTPYTRHYIYNAWWFEAIMVIFVINFIGNISRYRLWRKEKWSVLVLHISWILIIVGAAVTRYIGYEGAMAIREGATESQMLSLKTYLKGRIVGDYQVNGQLQQRNFEAEVDFSERLDNDFSKTYDYGGTPVTISVKKFITGAEKDIIPSDSGESYLKIVEAGGGKPHNHFLKDGEIENIHNILFTLNKYQEGAINITNTDEGLFIQSPYAGEYLTMATMTQGKLEKDSLQRLALRSRYIIQNMQFVIPKPVVKGEFGVVKKNQILKNDEDGVIVAITANDETKEVGLIGGQGSYNGFETINVGGLDIEIQYGSKVIDLPFQVKLNDFIAEKYPGTENQYRTYESKVTVLDEEKGDFDYHIYMNHILDHRGYRFFQSGFDPDEKGTILSVNHDMWGTYITYAGYFLLYIGLMAILFAPHTRFDSLRKQLVKLKKKKTKMLTAVLLFFGLLSFGQHSANDGHNHEVALKQTQIDSILEKNITPKSHADKFSRIVIQDVSGRMMPMHTFASEILRKLSKNDSYGDFNASQVFLSMQESPQLWTNTPLIYLKPKKADTIRTIIGVDKSEKHVRFVDFFTEKGAYKLEPYLAEAYREQVPTAIQKEFREANDRVRLLFEVIEGNSVKIFPVPNDEGNKWISSKEFRLGGYRETVKDSTYASFINNGFNAYLLTLNQAKQTGDFSTPNQLLSKFKDVQNQYGSEVMLSDKKIEAEILYNEYDIFKKLFSWYMYAGTLLFILIIVQIFKDKSKWLQTAINILVGAIIFLFLLHTCGLILRWYLSGHAPWSDAYESMIYVAWSIMLFGILLSRTKKEKSSDSLGKSIAAMIIPIYGLFQRGSSQITLAAAAFITANVLMIAHWNWMDPAIANLQPVLNSYWLMIHVAVIVGSYGPLALGMILGLVALLLMIFTTKHNKARMGINIKELTVINEMALTVGLVMLTIGNFLGGMWANESWGRYWGWDPKETWALISIMIYAFVIHMRIVPGLRGKWIFNLLSVVAFGSVLMTYFGVNFYLAGLHSYASGDKIISVQFIGITLLIIAIIGFFAYRKNKIYY